MASKYWIKLYHEILRDPKMGRLPDRTWRRAIELFLLAGETAQNGMLPALPDMAWALRVPEEELSEDLGVLATAGIVTETEAGWVVTHFAERQAPSTATERSRFFRARTARESVRMPDAVQGTWQADLWKTMPDAPGVYQITLGATGKVYIGASVSMQQRVRQHLTEMATGGHCMSADLAEHGPESLSVMALYTADSTAGLKDKEREFLAAYAPEQTYNTERAKRNRHWGRNASGTNRCTEPDTDKDTDTEVPVGASAPVVDTYPTTFEGWKEAIRASSNRNAVLMRMHNHLFPGNDPPEFSRLGKLAREVGGAARLAQLMWELSTRPPAGSVVDYLTAQETNRKARANGTNGHNGRASPGGIAARNKAILDRYMEGSYGDGEGDEGDFQLAGGGPSGQGAGRGHPSGL